MCNLYNGEISPRTQKYVKTMRVSEILANMGAVKTAPVKENSWASFMFLTEANEWFTIDILENGRKKLSLKFSPKYRGHNYSLSIQFDRKKEPCKYIAISPHGKTFTDVTARGLLYQIPTANRWRLELKNALAMP